MILFYNKQNGEIFATIDGRVHDEKQLKCYVNNGIGEENIGRYIIGWIENKTGKQEYNMDKFEILQRFEDITLESPLDYKVDIDAGNLIKK
jgi:ABC-type transport system involved in cytochrome c biogenesis ATPase subunit